MEKIERVGKLPVNSRILVDYTKTPPSIDFEYPDTDTSIIRKSSVTIIISMFIATFMFLVLYTAAIVYVQPAIYHNISYSDIDINKIEVSDYLYFNGTNYVNGTNYGFDELRINYTWNNKPQYSILKIRDSGVFFLTPSFYDEQTTTAKYALKDGGQGAAWIAILFLLIYLNSFWVSKIFKDTKWGNKNYPLLNKKLSDARFSAEFTPENFPLATKFIEIPLFKNMYMDYDATGDFAEQLIKVSIVEHPFNVLIKKGRIKKTVVKKPNIYLWKCIFEFKETPVGGKIEVRWT